MRTTRSTWMRFAALMGGGLAAVACSSAPGAPASDAVERTAGATAALGGETTACTPSMLSWSDPTSTSSACGGPWLYRDYAHPCYNLGTDGFICGWNTTTCLSCLHDEIGRTAGTSQDVSIGCRTIAPKGCSGTLQAACNTAATRFKSSVQGNTVNVIASGALTGAISVEDVDTGIFERHQTCQITLQNAAYGASPKCTSGTTTTCKTSARTCRSPSFGTAPLGQCGTDTSTWVSSQAGGQSRASLQAADPYANVAPDQSTCTTFEQLPIGTAAEAQARVAQTLPLLDPAAPQWATVTAPPSVEASARDVIVRELELLFELEGNLLTEEQRKSIRALYDLRPDVAASCGGPATGAVSDACVPFGAAAGLNGMVGLCRRLESSHVPAAVLDEEVPGCLGLLTHPALRGTDACVGEYRSAIETIAESLIDRQLAALAPGSGGAPPAGIGAVLSRIDAWFRSAEVMFAADPAALDAAESRVMAKLWTRVNEVVHPLPASFPAGAAGTDAARDQIAALFGAELDAARYLLGAAFASPAPLSTRPLLRLVSDALGPLAEKLDHAAPYYDFACRYRRCAPREANEAALLYRLMGALTSASELTGALGSTASLRPEWRDVFTAIRDRHPALVAAYRDAVKRPDADLTEILSGTVGGAGGDLGLVAGAASARWSAYAQTGFLRPHTVGVLRTGLDDARRVGMADQFDLRRADLRGAVQSLKGARGDFANTILSRIQSGQLLTHVHDEVVQVLREMLQQSDDLEGMRRAEAHEQDEHGDFMARYLENAARPGWIPDYPVNQQASLLALDAGAARWTSGFVRTADLATVAVRDPAHPDAPWLTPAAKGDLITFKVAGQWAPTCALRSASLAGPGGPGSVADPIHALTGPEGYTLTWESDHFQAHSFTNSRDDFQSSTSTTSLCATANVKLAGVVLDGIDVASAGLSGSACESWESGTKISDTTSDSTGDHAQYTAGFAGGLRLENTPFPTLPAGALLLVEAYDAPEGLRVRDIHVVGRDSAFLMPADSKLMLVVNDGHCATYDTSSLAVTILHAQSAAAASQALAGVMADVLTDLRASEATYVAEGSVTSTELHAIETGAYDRLRTACGGCAIESYPATVRGMFDAWLSFHLAAVEREVRMSALERQMDLDALRLVSFSHDRESAADQGRVEQLLTRWQLGNLSGHQLEAEAALLFESSDEYLFPMLQIRYPTALDQIRSSAAAVLDDLRSEDFMAPIEAFADKAETVASVVSARLRTAALSGTSRTAPLVLAFPKPPIPGATDEGGDLFGDGAAAGVGWNKAQASRREMVWEPVTDATSGAVIDYRLRAKAVFDVRPEDVYQDHQGGLFCFEAAPVIRSMALFAVTGSDSRNAEWNANPRRRPAYPSVTRLFSHEAAGQLWRIENPDWSAFALRILAGREDDTTTVFNTTAASEHAVQGLSPFGTFTVDFASSITDGSLLSQASSVLVVMDVEPRGSLGPLADVTACQ